MKVKRIALLLESGMAFDRAIARGIGNYIRNNRGWVILMDPMMEVTKEGLQHWNPDGIIVDVHSPGLSAALDLGDVPVVGVGSYSEKADGHLDIPIVTSNQQEIGRLAARHFISRGFKDFAFCAGDETAEWCRQREEGFAEELEKQGFSYEAYVPDLKGHITMPEALRSLGKWMHRLPKPTGVFVYFDGWARWVLDACVIEDLKVPQEIAVLGVDNDRWLCELSQPRLSSVDPNVLTAGFLAAEILDNTMRAQTVTKVSRIDPCEVVSRDSTELMAFKEPEVAFAIRYIREHACDPITPADVLKVTGMSNSTAYRKFKSELGRSIHSEIQRVQMEQIKKLLITTNLNVTEVARKSGFENVRYLTKVFRELTGMTPIEYRRKQSTPEIADASQVI
ncbi:MAG: DNA-binding transcriptional regulator [Oceanipulchritudo sp.]